MSAFGGLILTNRGRNLQAKIQAGDELKYTRIALGDGNLGSTPIVDLTSLKNEVKSLSIQKLKVLTQGRALIGTVLSNQDLSTGFYFREIGVFALDPDIGEVLYCYGNSGGLAEYIPAGGGPDVIEKNIDIQTLVGNTQNVTAVIDNSLVYATEAELRQVEDNLMNEIENIIVPVTSVNNKNGDIILKANDIDIVDIENNFTSTNVEGAIAELFQSVTNGKDDLYSVLVAKGVEPMSRDFQDLYNAVITDDFVRTIDADALDSHILSEKKAVVNGNLITGIIPSKGATTITPGTTNQTIAAGQYLSGVQTIAGDADLVSSNIKAGASIFEVAGNSNVVDTSEGTAIATQILNGQKAYVKGNLITGSMINRGAVTSTITTQNGQYTIPEGYHDGSGKVTAAFVNLVAGNIKSDVNIGGIIGTLIEGYKFASGTLSTISTNGAFPKRTMAFRPKVVLILYSNMTATDGLYYSAIYVDSSLFSGGVSVGVDGHHDYVTCNFSIASDGFSVSGATGVFVTNRSGHKWLAFG